MSSNIKAFAIFFYKNLILLVFEKIINKVNRTENIL